jgi:hypothetical protein
MIFAQGILDALIYGLVEWQYVFAGGGGRKA